VNEAAAFHPAGILAVLDKHKVAYVLIGGYAAQLHGSILPTTDIDVTPGYRRGQSRAAGRGVA
jgi:hypothetical protein